MNTCTQPITEHDFEAYYRLRYEVLRKPWNQPLGSEKDADEATSTHVCIKNEQDEIIAVCRLQAVDKDIAQIRYMAIKENLHGKGLGKQIMNYTEGLAKEQGFTAIHLHARENAVEFYKSCGYITQEKSYLLWGLIQHYLMTKSILVAGSRS